MVRMCSDNGQGDGTMTRRLARAMGLMLLPAMMAVWAVNLLDGVAWAQPPGELPASYSIPLTVTSQLPVANVPLDPLVDFDKALSAINATGVLDPNSIEIREMGTDRVVAHSLETVSGSATGDGCSGLPHGPTRGPTRSVFGRRPAGPSCGPGNSHP